MTEEYTYKNCIVRIHHPEITKEEYQKRYEELKKETERFIFAAERKKGAVREN